MKRHAGTPSGGPRAHLLTETGYSNWAKHPLKKAEERQENKGLHRAALTLILMVLHHFNSSTLWCMYYDRDSQWYARSCMHPPKGRRALIKHTWRTPTIPTALSPPKPTAVLPKPVPLDGAEKQNSSQAVCAAALPKSQVATCFLLTGH